MTHIQITANLSSLAHEEGRVVAVISLYGHGYLASDPAKSRAENIASYLEVVGVKDVPCWLNEFGIT